MTSSKLLIYSRIKISGKISRLILNFKKNYYDPNSHIKAKWDENELCFKNLSSFLSLLNEVCIQINQQVTKNRFEYSHDHWEISKFVLKLNFKTRYFWSIIGSSSRPVRIAPSTLNYKFDILQDTDYLLLNEQQIHETFAIEKSPTLNHPLNSY